MEKSKLTFLFLAVFLNHFPFLRAADNLLPCDMRSIAMGGNEATASAMFNPSLIAMSARKSVRLNYFNRYALKELGTAGGSIYLPDIPFPTGFDVSSFGYDAYRESMFRLLMAKRLSSHWALGVGIRYALLQTELFEEQPARLSTDVGVTYIPVDNLLISMFIMNLPSVSFNDKYIEDKIFTSYLIQAGFQWEVINRLLISAALSATDNTMGGCFGIEYAPFDDFSIRAGLKGAPMLPSFGVGYCFSDFEIDVAVVYHPVLGVSQGVGVAFSF
jgi:hypothetical protein